MASFLEKLRSESGIRAITDTDEDAEEVLELVKKYDRTGEHRDFLRLARTRSALIMAEMKNRY